MPFTFEGVNVEEVFRRTVSKARTDRRVVRIVMAHEPEAAVTAGLLAKVLRASDVEFEFITDLFKPVLDDAQVIGVNMPVNLFEGSVIFQSSTSTVFTRVGFNYIFKYASLALGVLDLVSEFELITKDFKLTLAAAVLTKRTPRLEKGGLNSKEEELMSRLKDDGLIDVVECPPIMGWSSVGPGKAVRTSIDVLVPSLFLKDEPKEVKPEEIASELGIKPEEFKGKEYVVKTQWVAKDLMLAAYALDWMSDAAGAESVALSMLNQSYVRWGAAGLLSSFPDLRRIINRLPEYRRVRLSDRTWVIVDDVNPRRFSAVVAWKALRSSRLIKDPKEVLALEHNNEYFVSARILPQTTRIKLAERGTLVAGGYYVVKDLKEIQSSM